MISLFVQEQVMAEQRKMLINNIIPNRIPKAMQSHLSQLWKRFEEKV